MPNFNNPGPIYVPLPPGGELANMPLNPPLVGQNDAAGGGQVYQPPPPGGSDPRLNPRPGIDGNINS